MSAVPQKATQQPAAPAAAAITSSGTGSSSTRFRRQKIVPSVVARKFGANSSTKSSPKVASSKEGAKEAPNHEESKQAADKEEERATEVINLQQETVQTIETPSSCQVEEAQVAVVREDAPQAVIATSTAKPPVAFRRIKPKVAIPQTQKPAKSILKNATTPGKEKPYAENVVCVAKEDFANALQKENTGPTVDAVSQQNDPVTVTDESMAPKEQSFPGEKGQDTSATSGASAGESIAALASKTLTTNTPLVKTIKRTMKISDCAPQIADLLKSSIKGKKSAVPGKPASTNGKVVVASKPPDLEEKLQNVSLTPKTLHEQEKPHSTQCKPSSENSAAGVAAAEKVPGLEMRIDSIPPVSASPATPSTPCNAANAVVAAPKTIKRTYNVGHLAPQIADLIKASICKKTVRSTHPNGKVATVSKPPDPNSKLEHASLPPNASHERLESKSAQMVAQHSKLTTEDCASTLSVTDIVPVLEIHLDKDSPNETIEPDPQPAEAAAAEAAETAEKVTVLEPCPDDACRQSEAAITIPPTPSVNPKPPPAPAEKAPTAVGQVSGGKQIQKVLKLTPEQWQSALQSAKNRKKAKNVILSKAKNDNNNVAATPPQAAIATESIPNEPPAEVPFVAPEVSAKSSGSTDANRVVNIISNIVLPPLNVPNGSPRSANTQVASATHGTATHPNIFSVSDDAVAISMPTMPPCPTSTAAVSPNVPPIYSGQYPKLLILHKPASASPSALSPDPSCGRLKLPQHSLSVTVLPSQTVRTGHSPIVPSPPKRPFALPTPEVTVTQTSPKQTPYANAAPAPLPTPIISVTVTPAANDDASNCFLANRVDPVPGDTRIVPKIVIDECDTADHDDSQASHSSTSSSSSSGQHAVPKNQPKNRSDCSTATPVKDCSTTTGMGCSPDIRDKLRAKSLFNLKMKKESEHSGQIPRQYPGPVANKQQANDDANILQRAASTAGVLERGIKKSVDHANTESSTDSVVARGVVTNITSSTTPHSKTSKLEPRYVTSEVVRQSETEAAVAEPLPDVESNPVFKHAKEQSPDPLRKDVPQKGCAQLTPNKSKHTEAQAFNVPKNSAINDEPEDEPLVKSGFDDVAADTTDSNTESTNAPVDSTVCEETKDLEANVFFGFSSASIAYAERDFEDRSRTIDLVLAKRQSTEEGRSKQEQSIESELVEVDSEAATSGGPVADNLDRSGSSPAPSDASLKKIKHTTDSAQQMEEEPRENVVTDVQQTQEHSPETPLNGSVVVISDSDEAAAENERENDNNKKPAEEVTDCVANERLEENEPTPPLHQAATTGVDLIIAMAAMRRQKRIPSADDTSDREYEIDATEGAPATQRPRSSRSTPPSTASRGGPLGHRKERHRYKRSLEELLWKHVDVAALVKDLVDQEKRRFGYQLSSDEQEMSSKSESDELTPSSDGSLPEKTILDRILAKARTARGTSAGDGVVEKLSTECGQQPTAQFDQRDETEPCSVFIGDKSAEASNELLLSFASLPARSVAPVAQSNEAFVQEQPITAVCDKIETNVTICDTSSSAVTELNNTPTEQVQLAPGSRKRRLAEAARRFAKRKSSVRKRPKLSKAAAAPIEMPLFRFNSSDGSRDEVVSDCSSDGLSTVEVAYSSSSISRKPANEARTENLPSGSKGEPLGRSRIDRRRYSSSSSSNSSTSRNSVSLSPDGTLSARGESKSGKRRKVRCRTKRSEHKPATVVATVDCDTSPSTSTTSNLDASQVAGQSTPAAVGQAAAAPRAFDSVSLRNDRGLKPAEEQPPEQLGKTVPKKGRARATASKSKQAEPQAFNAPNNSAISDRVNSSVHHDPEDEPLVKCGNCGGDVVAAAWEDHANYHNGAAYRVGVDATLDMKNVKAISTAILRFMKLHNRKELACERCGMVKRSGVGMASHYISCGLTELELEQSKPACVHCGRKMKAVSLLVHQQQHCRVLKEQQRQSAASEKRDDSSAAAKETTASGRKKRKSGASAERMIKKMSKEINEDPVRELMVEVTGRGVSNAIMQCWLSHLRQSEQAVCSSHECPFFGMTSEHMRREHDGNGGADPKPLFQCGKCTYMSTSQDGIKSHLTTEHPLVMRQVAAQRRQTPNLTSGSDSDVYTGYKDGSTTDDYDSFAPEDEDEGKGNKGSKGKKSALKPKKTPSKAGSKAISAELLLDSSMVSGGADETDVYKEMVLQESIEYKQDKLKYHLMSAKWTEEFRRTHYAARLLFADLRPDVDASYLRSVANLKDYLPIATCSMRYVQCNSGQYEPGYTAEKFTHRWQQKQTFDGEALGCESMFFCGGPVVSLDWLPLPDGTGNDCDQFLAVACKQRYDEYYSCEQLAMPRRSHKCLVQIWNVGPIQNIGSTKITLRCPRLAFAIACDYGPIWQLAFCPSGCYNDPAQEGDNLDRLGLLAVAGSDGDVHLYALSRSMAGAEGDALFPRILPLRPAMLLSLSLSVESHNEPASDFTGRSVQRIAWSREKGHNVLAAGYSNGVVAVWNLSAQSSLLCGTKHGIRTLLPVHKVLHSSSSCITALDLHYSSGTRFLVVCNADRRLKVYDLGSGLYQPSETLSMVVRSRISAIRWMLHFPVLVIAYDDALYIDRCAYSVHQQRDIGLRMFNIFTVGSEMTDLGTNDWHSTNAVATGGGDLVCHRPVPFVHGMNYKKLPQILTTTIPMKLKAGDDSVDVSYYGGFSEEYGLLFADTDKVPTAMDTTALHLKTWRRAKFNHYPAVRLNQIRWNPNCNAYKYYAIGYQAGFVRVRVLRS